MLEQRASFSGLDTCNYVEFGHFDKYPQLIFYVERRAIYNRLDIDAHLNVLCKTKIILEVQASNIRDDVEKHFSKKNLKQITEEGHI